MVTQSPRVLDSFEYKNIIVAKKDRKTGYTVWNHINSTLSFATVGWSDHRGVSDNNK